MKHSANIIHKKRTSWEEYGDASEYVQKVAEAALNKRSSLSGWTQLAIMDEAWCQTTTLLLDFSEHIYFENDYFNDVLTRMPRNVANVVFSIVYLFLNDYGAYPGKLPDVQQMIASMLSGVRAMKMVMKASRRIIPLDGLADTNYPDFLSFFPNSAYFEDAEFVDWSRFTECFKTENVSRIMELMGGRETDRRAKVASSICGQAKAAMLVGNLTIKTFNAVNKMLSDVISVWKAANVEPSDPTAHLEEENARLRRMLSQEREKLAETEEYMLSGIGQGAAQVQIEADYEARIAGLEEQIKERDKRIAQLNQQQISTDEESVSLAQLEQWILGEESEGQRNKVMEALLILFANDDEDRWKPHHNRIKRLLSKRSKDGLTQPQNISISKLENFATGNITVPKEGRNKVIPVDKNKGITSNTAPTVNCVAGGVLVVGEETGLGQQPTTSVQLSDSLICEAIRAALSINGNATSAKWVGVYFAWRADDRLQPRFYDYREFMKVVNGPRFMGSHENEVAETGLKNYCNDSYLIRTPIEEWNEEEWKKNGKSKNSKSRWEHVELAQRAAMKFQKVIKGEGDAGQASI